MRKGDRESEVIVQQIENMLKTYPQFNDCKYSRTWLSMNIYFPNDAGNIYLRIPSRRRLSGKIKYFVTLVVIVIDQEIRGQGITHLVLDVLESIVAEYQDLSAVEVESAQSLEMLRILEKRGYKKIPGLSAINFYSSLSFC